MRKFGIVLALALGLGSLITPAEATTSWVSMAPINVKNAIANDATITYYSDQAYKLSQGTLVTITGITSSGGNNTSTWFDRRNVKITSATKTSFTVNYGNGPSIPITTVSVALDGAAVKATYTTSRAHELQVGDLVAVTGLSPSTLNTVANGTPILSLTDTTFTVASKAAVGQHIDTANTLEPAVSQVLNAPVTAVSFAGSGATKTITYTTRIPHGLLVGDKVAVSGVMPTSLNIKATAPKTISAVTSTTFTVPWVGVNVVQSVANKTSSAFSSVFSPVSSQELVAGKLKLVDQSTSGRAVSAFSWENFHIIPAAGLFETFHREYQSGFTTIYGASPSQHSVAYAIADPSNSSNSVKSVTFKYSADASQIGKMIAFQFSAQSGEDDHDISSDFTSVYTGTNNLIEVVSDGSTGAKAEFTLTRTSEPFADADGNGDVLNAAFVAGNSVLGDMTVHWARPGFGPIVKLVGTSTSPVGICGPSTSLGLTVHICGQTGFRDETFDWSVANRAWFQEDSAYDYAQAWSKSYAAGDLVDMKYRVTDIWGNPISNHNVIFALDSTKDSKWSKDGATLRTDTNGYVIFQSKNLNTPAQVAAHIDYNPDTGKPTAGILSFQVRANLSPTNPGPECVDLVWFQLNSGAPIAPTAANIKLQRIGSVNFPPTPPTTDALAAISSVNISVDPSLITGVTSDGTSMTYVSDNEFSVGDVVRIRNLRPSYLNSATATITASTANSFTVACAASFISTCTAAEVTVVGTATRSGATLPTVLPLDINGERRNDIISAQLALTSPFNTFSYINSKGKRVSQPQELYNPNFTIKATNGGLSAVASAAQKTASFVDFADASSFRSTVVFGVPCYIGGCIQDLVFMATKPGLTTWTISYGTWSQSFSFNYSDIPDGSRARYLKADQTSFVAIADTPQTTTYTLVDRNGNAYAGRDVLVEVNNGSLVKVNDVSTGAMRSATSTTDANGKVTVISQSSAVQDQIVIVSITNTNGSELTATSYERFDATSGSTKTIAAGVASATTTISFGKIVVKSVTAKKAGANVLVWNASGKRVVVKEGTKTLFTSPVLSSAQQTISVPLVKGKHTLTISIAGMTPNVTAVVTAS